MKISIDFFFYLECHFIIHEHCQSNIPPMCTISYDSISQALSDRSFTTDALPAVRFHSSAREPSSDKDSKSSSLDLSWLDPLPKFDSEKRGSISLATFKDFEYIGRLGEGVFAQVYCVQHIPSKQYVAIKVADGKNEHARQQLEVERQILFRYSHGNPFMIKAYCAFHQGVCLNVFYLLIIDENLVL
jgi:hypothetical protein